MDRIELVTLKDPYRFHDWTNAHQKRVSFLRDIMFIMRQQYPDTELVFSLDPADDDMVIVEPSGLAEPYRFRVSEYCAIEEMLQPHLNSTSYRNFVQRYEEWCRQFEVWIRSYNDYITRLKSTTAYQKAYSNA